MFERVRKSVYAIQAYFRTETQIAGIPATDIFTLGATLGASIEDQVVRTLNAMRPIWDPDGKYSTCFFVRQPQTFPDVLLTSHETGSNVIMGVELKGWYLLAKEGEPSFRFTATEAACAPADLIVIIPWALSNVLSGSPVVFAPFLEQARYAAAYRNYHWKHLRQAKAETVAIRQPSNVRPYPKKGDQIADRPESDAGGNFGRIARSGIMDAYINEMMGVPLCGIPAREWVSFFKKFAQ